MPFTDSPFFEELLRKAKLDAQDEKLVRDYREKGYVVIDLKTPDFDATAASIIRDLAPRYPKDDRRVAEAWYWHDGVRKVACDPSVLAAVRTLYQRDPIPFQTLNFDCGTLQPAHSDTIHFHSVPHHYMCGVWVAFEDIQEGTGELFVVPGSHKLKTCDMHDLGLVPDPSGYHGYEETLGRVIASLGLTRVPVYPKKGQAVIWHANLMHGGMPHRRPGSTRHSQASHYYFDDCLYYFPMGSEPFMGKMVVREVIDIRNGRFVKHKYRGEEIKLSDYQHVLTYERPLPDWVEKPPAGVPNVDPATAHLHSRIQTLEGSVEALRARNRELSGQVAQLEAAAHAAPQAAQQGGVLKRTVRGLFGTGPAK